MPRDVRAYLWDIARAGEAILSFVAGLDPIAYAESDVVSSAVERKFEIIGEALNLLSKLDPDLAASIPDAREVIAFRNVLVHGYASIQHHRVWTIANESLPTLISAVTERLRELGEA